MRIFVVIVACLLCTPLFAVKEYYSLSRSVRALGMGGAFYGYSDDEYALFYNPAGLAFYPGGAQFMVGFGAHAANDSISAINTISSATSSSGDIETLVTKIEALQGKPIYASAHVMPYFVAKGFALGILVAETKMDFALLGRGLDSILDVTAISDTGLLMSFAGSLFNPRLQFGVTAKALARAGGTKQFDPQAMLTSSALKLEDIGGAGGGVDFDIGATYELNGKGSRNGGVSLVFSNLLASEFTLYRQKGAPPPLIRTVSLGGFYEWRPGKTIEYVRFLADFAEWGIGGTNDPNRGARTGSVWKHVNLGVEVPLWNFLTLRAGVHQGGPTGGLGISAYALKLEIANYAEELASGPGRLSSRRWALRVAIGFGAPAPGLKVKKKGK